MALPVAVAVGDSRPRLSVTRYLLKQVSLVVLAEKELPNLLSGLEPFYEARGHLGTGSDGQEAEGTGEMTLARVEMESDIHQGPPGALLRGDWQGKSPRRGCRAGGQAPALLDNAVLYGCSWLFPAFT